VILGLSGLILPPLNAQQRPELKRKQQDAPERPPESKKKKIKGPRAVGVLQIVGSGKPTLIPVAILVDGKFYDASVYKADPVPMALEGGTVYEVEQAGQSQGLFTVRGAMHNSQLRSPNPWLGAGSYVLNGTEVAKTSHSAEDVPRGIDNSTDAPPRLTRGKESKETTQPASPPAKPSGSSPGANPSQTPPKPASPSAPSTDPDKSADQSGKDKAPSSESEKASDGKPSPSAGSSSKSSSSQDQPSLGKDSQNYYRPTLRRGKPTETAPVEEEPAPKAVKSTSPGSAGGVRQEPARLMPAISDSGGPDPQSYEFFWKEGEENERRKQMVDLAAEEVRAYIAAREKGAIPAKPSVSKPAAKVGTGAHKSTAKPAQPLLENVQFHAFDVWRNSQPVMILSAEAHLSPTPGTDVTSELYNVTVAAKTDIYGNLRKLYSGVTDKFHLDVTPRLDLIDVVDADGDGRGELLFRETTDAGNGYVIYRATADKLWKLFDSLSSGD
jgi:hypothetical protein